MDFNEAYGILLQLNGRSAEVKFLAPEIVEAIDVVLKQANLETAVGERLDCLILRLQEARRGFSK